jgi:hypothetical protein
MIARLLAALIAALALVSGGYLWGDTAATNRAGAQALNAEHARSVARAIADAGTAKVEHNAAYDQYLISSAYQKGLTDGAATQKSVVARIRSGALRLSIPTRPAAAGSGPAVPAVAATPGRCDGQARAQLSDEAAEFLTGLASEADDVVRQLGACQAIAEKQSKACNREPVGR